MTQASRSGPRSVCNYILISNFDGRAVTETGVLAAATTITPISVMTNALPSGHAARNDQTIHDALPDVARSGAERSPLPALAYQSKLVNHSPTVITRTTATAMSVNTLSV